jgi:hypothetical protein
VLAGLGSRASAAGEEGSVAREAASPQKAKQNRDDGDEAGGLVGGATLCHICLTLLREKSVKLCPGVC